MPLHPQAKLLCDLVNAVGGPSASDDMLQQARDGLALLIGGGAGDPGPIHRIDHVDVPSPTGAVRVLVYRPSDDDGLPIVVYFHGGGWTLGSAAAYEPLVIPLANAVPCVVVSVDYRLAPEFPFPAPLDDCWAVVKWVSEHAAEIGGDPARVAVAGDSAGGNLAAVVALLARDAGAPRLAAQVLAYPVTDCGFDTPSYVKNATGYVLEAEQMRWFFDCYTRGGADASDWRISPLRASDHSGVAPALVITAEFDPLRDEGEAYAAALERSGVLVEHVRYDGMIHVFYGLRGAFDSAVDAFDRTVKMLQQSFENGRG